MSDPPERVQRGTAPTLSFGQCLCGAVGVEIGVPARWAWHDHSAITRRAQGAAYATYVGSWKSRFRFTRGTEFVALYRDEQTGATRSFCSRCGTPLAYERGHAPQMVNVPRAMFDRGVGREPLYHIGIDEAPEWAYAGDPLSPLKGFPGVVRSWPRKRRR